jgi:hypothetical protein
MTSWFTRKTKTSSRLAELLADYPPFTPLYLGRNGPTPYPGPVLTLDQCFDNLHHYKASIAERLIHLRGVLAGLGITMDQAYSEPLAFVKQLHRTLIVELPPLYRAELFKRANHELSDRAGADIGLSFMSDLAKLECDVLMKAKPGCFIGLNLDPADRNMLFYRRPCLLGLMDSLFPGAPDIFDIEAEYFGYFSNMDFPGRLAHPDAILPVTYVDVIGGMLLIRLDRYVIAPNLKQLLLTTWMKQSV